VSYFERCQDWLISGETKSAEALTGALQGIERKLSALGDHEAEDYQDLECTLELLQEQLELLSQPVPQQVQPVAPVVLDAQPAAVGTSTAPEPALDLQGLHPLDGQPINLNQQQKAQALESLLSNPWLGKGMPKSS